MIGILLYLAIGLIGFCTLLISDARIFSSTVRKEFNKLYPSVWSKRLGAVIIAITISTMWLPIILMTVISVIAIKIYELD